MLMMMARQGDQTAFELAHVQYQNTGNMSERLGALRVLFGKMRLKLKRHLLISMIALKMKPCL